jgi:hypothetical protein
MASAPGRPPYRSNSLPRRLHPWQKEPPLPRQASAMNAPRDPCVVGGRRLRPPRRPIRPPRRASPGTAGTDTDDVGTRREPPSDDPAGGRRAPAGQSPPTAEPTDRSRGRLSHPHPLSFDPRNAQPFAAGSGRAGARGGRNPAPAAGRPVRPACRSSPDRPVARSRLSGSRGGHPGPEPKPPGRSVGAGPIAAGGGSENLAAPQLLVRPGRRECRTMVAIRYFPVSCFRRNGKNGPLG